MERREFMAALGGGAVVLAGGGQGVAQAAEEAMNMHPAKYKALQDACLHCVQTANDCLRHCIGMLAMKDYSMTGCFNTAYQVAVSCGALQALAAVNSSAVPLFAKAAAQVCEACQKECEKHLDTPECRACAESCKACAAECAKVAA